MSRPAARGLARNLTSNEKAILPAALGRSFDLDAVLVIGRWHTPLAAALKVTVVRGERIFWANAPHESRSLGELAHLAHELVHVWQYKVLRRTGVELLASRIYRYRLSPDRSFLSYGYEQQASIVEDWFRLRNGARPRAALQTPIDPDDYERVISTVSKLSAAGADIAIASRNEDNARN